VIEGVLPTAVAVSSLGVGTVLATIVGFVLIYTVLAVIEMKLMFKAIRKGPEEHPVPPPAFYRAEADPELGATS
jgi:cytochrome d ubiquinol oxidase subunit I